MMLVEFPEEISPAVNSQVQRLAFALETRPIPGVIEWIPSYRSLGVIYNPLEISFNDLVSLLDKIEASDLETGMSRTRRIEIPVLYGGEMGPDLPFVARYQQLSPESVIEIHTGNGYLVYLTGFTPGFPYLSGMSPRIATPRLVEPRPRVPAGSVAIGGQQTGIYPVDSPGGWRIIGRTPLRIFDLDRSEPFLLKPGDTVNFRSITLEEFEDLEMSIEASHGDSKTRKA